MTEPQKGGDMTPTQTIEWSKAQDAAGKTDAMGYPWTSWLLSKRLPDGTAMRDELGHQLFETQAEFKARIVNVPCGKNMELFV